MPANPTAKSPRDVRQVHSIGHSLWHAFPSPQGPRSPYPEINAILELAANQTCPPLSKKTPSELDRILATTGAQCRFHCANFGSSWPPSSWPVHDTLARSQCCLAKPRFLCFMDSAAGRPWIGFSLNLIASRSQVMSCWRLVNSCILPHYLGSSGFE